MPPHTDIIHQTGGGSIQSKPSVHPLTIEEECIVGFYDLTAAGTAIAASGFDLQEELQLLVECMRDPNPKVKLKAQSQWRSTLKDIVETSGLSGSAVATVEEKTEDGRTIRRVASTRRLLASIQRDRSHAETEERVHPIHFDPAGSRAFTAPIPVAPVDLSRGQDPSRDGEPLHADRGSGDRSPSGPVPLRPDDPSPDRMDRPIN